MDFMTDKDLINALAGDGAFLTATNSKGDVNTMTINWFFTGQLWYEDYVIALVRQTRYTKEFLDDSEHFTLSIPIDGLKEELEECGTKSGRDIDKSKVVDFIDARSIPSKVVDHCNGYYECEIMAKQTLGTEAMKEEIIKEAYETSNIHTLYFGKVVDHYKK